MSDEHRAIAESKMETFDILPSEVRVALSEARYSWPEGEMLDRLERGETPAAVVESIRYMDNWLYNNRDRRAPVNKADGHHLISFAKGLQAEIDAGKLKP